MADLPDSEEVRTQDDLEVASGEEDLVVRLKDPKDSRTASILTYQLRRFVDDASSRPRQCLPKSTTDAIFRRTQPNEIRVVYLYPGNREDSLRCELEYVSIEFEFEHLSNAQFHTPFAVSLEKKKKIPFTALSYSWGESKHTSQINIGNNTLAITPTLDTILRQIRNPIRTLTLWVDWLCIDQADDNDKATQVMLMRSIYSRAMNTVIWLRPEAGDTAFKFLNGTRRAGVHLQNPSDADLQRLRNPAGEDPNTLQSFRDLFRCSWFQRTWTIQEAILSQNAYFMAGGDSISWEKFAGDCYDIRHLNVIPSLPSHNEGHQIRCGLSIAAELFDSKLNRKVSQDANNLLEWLVDTRYAGVTDPKDKVYALLGICGINIYPNYSEDYLYHNMYLDVAARIIQDAIENKRERNLVTRMGLEMADHRITRILSCIDADPDIEDLPSWVPDWSKPRLATAIGYTTASAGLFNAGSGLPGEIFAIDKNGKCLEAQGIFIGTIQSVSKVFDDAKLTCETPFSPAANASLRESIQFVQNRPQGCTPLQENFFSTFSSTLVAGTDASGRFKPKPEYLQILSLLCDSTSGYVPSIPHQIYTERQKKGCFNLRNLLTRDPARDFADLKVAYSKALLYRRLGWLSEDLALLPRYAEQADEVWVLQGVKVPFLLRRISDGRHKIVGECYVHSLMRPLEDSETARAVSHNSREWQSLIIG